MEAIAVHFQTNNTLPTTSNNIPQYKAIISNTTSQFNEYQ